MRDAYFKKLEDRCWSWSRRSGWLLSPAVVLNSPTKPGRNDGGYFEWFPLKLPQVPFNVPVSVSIFMVDRERQEIDVKDRISAYLSSNAVHEEVRQRGYQRKIACVTFAL
ncbi:hypothetical protein TNIN_458401 [Trichonephila inaurata madagascariensis]|uniref:Uncharacterized protein n=1 Tax=Trichonephila inaurata madagascariensis TaxID=2747483 RepID=A0A8X7CJT2_9ARAC|nr:hypothetical protein TNIN_458401 [Trichonephila inaurata madagascariensis]